MNFLIIISIIFLIIIFCIKFFDRKGIPIFLYHQVNRDSKVTPELFEEHLKILKEKNMELIKIGHLLNKTKKQIKNSAMITFDDGYYDNYKYVFPLLKKYNMKATIFLNTFYIKERREETPDILDSREANYLAALEFLENGNGTSYQYMTWEEIKEMNESGLVDFQAHSHQHKAIFENFILLDIFKKDERESSDVYSYGKIKEGYPKFRKRGEYSIQGIEIKNEFFELFRNFYLKTLKNKNKKTILKEGQNFIDENIEKYIKRENDEDFKLRIKKEYLQNKNLIEEKLGNKVNAFCWPWGHRGKKAIEILKECGVEGFVSTKKGTNYSTKVNFEFIKRIELRDFSTKKFKINLFIGRNYILGKIYQLFS